MDMPVVLEPAVVGGVLVLEQGRVPVHVEDVVVVLHAGTQGTEVTRSIHASPYKTQSA